MNFIFTLFYFSLIKKKKKRRAPWWSRLSHLLPQPFWRICVRWGEILIEVSSIGLWRTWDFSPTLSCQRRKISCLISSFYFGQHWFDKLLWVYFMRFFFNFIVFHLTQKGIELEKKKKEFICLNRCCSCFLDESYSCSLCGLNIAACGPFCLFTLLLMTRNNEWMLSKQSLESNGSRIMGFHYLSWPSLFDIKNMQNFAFSDVSIIFEHTF